MLFLVTVCISLFSASFASQADVACTLSASDLCDGLLKELPTASSGFLLEFKDDFNCELPTDAGMTDLPTTLRASLVRILGEAFETHSKDALFGFLDSMSVSDKELVTNFLVRVINRLSAAEAARPPVNSGGLVRDERKVCFWRTRLESFETRERIIHDRFKAFDDIYAAISMKRSSSPRGSRSGPQVVPVNIFDYDAVLDKFLKAREDRYNDSKVGLENVLLHISQELFDTYVPTKRADVGLQYEKLMRDEKEHIKDQLAGISI